jgi:Glycosyl hydrolase family 48
VGVAASLAKVYECFAAKSGSPTTTETAAQNIIDTIHKYCVDRGGRQWPKVQAYLNGGSPRFNYHRFWAEVDIAAAFESFAQLFPAAQPPSGF